MSAVGKNALSTILINNFGFAPISIKENRIGFVSLHKQYAGTHMVVEIHESQGISQESMTTELNETCDRIYNSRSRDPIHFFKIFLFQNTPLSEVVQVMTDAQFIDPVSKRHLSCYFVDISRNEKHKLFPQYVKSETVDAALEKLLNVNVGEEPVYDTSAIHQMVLDTKRAEEGNRLTFYVSTPFVTYILIAINLIIYFLVNFLETKSKIDYNFIFGSKVNGLIIAGEFYRLVTPMFLHGSNSHIFMNCYSLYSLSIVERLYGHTKFLIIYLVSGLLGVAASSAFNAHDSLGASGAIFGAFGALLYFGIEKPQQFTKYFRQGVVVSLLLNVVFGIQNKTIDNSAHFGGLAGGFLTAGVMMVEANIEKYKNRLAYFTGAVVVLFGLLYYGFVSKTNNALVGEAKAREYYNDSKYAKVLEVEEAVFKNKDLIPKEYLLRAYYNFAVSSLLVEDLQRLKFYASEVVNIWPFHGHWLLSEYYLKKDEINLAKIEYQHANEYLGNVKDADYQKKKQILDDLNIKLTTRIGN